MSSAAIMMGYVGLTSKQDCLMLVSSKIREYTEKKDETEENSKTFENESSNCKALLFWEKCLNEEKEIQPKHELFTVPLRVMEICLAVILHCTASNF